VNAARIETLILPRAYVASRVPPAAYFDAVESAFLALARGELETPAVGHVPGAGGAMHIKTAAERCGARLAVIKVNANFPENPALRGLPTIQGFIALFDAECGALLALIDSIEITARRTAAASALAARHLARADACVLALIGCGVQARCHIDALAERYAFAEVRCHDRERSRAEALADTIRRRGLVVRVCDSVASATHDASIIVTTTPSTRPVLADGDVAPGTFVAAVGADNPSKQELEVELLRCARVVPDVLAQAVAMGDLRAAVAAGALRADDIHAELADLVSRRIAGRTRDDERFVFDSTGTAIEDLAAARAVYAIALADPAAPRVALGAA